MMDEFVMYDATGNAKALVSAEPPRPSPACWNNSRIISESFSSYPKGGSRERLSVSDTGFIIIGDERIDIRGLHDIATEAQVNALAFMLRYLAKDTESIDELKALALAMRGLSPKRKPNQKAMDVTANVSELYKAIETNGLDIVDTGFFTTMNRFMDMPRHFELLAAISRMRHVVWQKTSNSDKAGHF
jgi:hypothetical protein